LTRLARSAISDAILATYLPSAVNEPGTGAQPPPPVTPHPALAHIEGLPLFSLQAEPTANITELQDVLKRALRLLRFSTAGLPTFCWVPPDRYPFRSLLYLFVIWMHI